MAPSSVIPENGGREPGTVGPSAKRANDVGVSLSVNRIARLV